MDNSGDNSGTLEAEQAHTKDSQGRCMPNFWFIASDIGQGRRVIVDWQGCTIIQMPSIKAANLIVKEHNNDVRGAIENPRPKYGYRPY